MKAEIRDERGDGGEVPETAHPPCEVVEDFSVPEQDPSKKREGRPGGQSVAPSVKVREFPSHD